MEHFYKSLEGWFTFPQLYEWVVKRAKDNSHFVEVGIYKGQSAAHMAVEIINSNKNIKFDCIDPFPDYPGPETGDDVCNAFIRGMKPVENYYTLKRESSPEVASSYEDESLDFVFIDGEHSYEGVVLDMKAWMPKIKVGGILAGHDYVVSETVYRAVTEALGNPDLRDPWNCGCFVVERTETGFVKAQINPHFSPSFII